MRHRNARAALLLVPALLLFVSACDSADPTPTEDVAIVGTVTVTPDHSQQPGPDDAVEDATVTAATVGAGGQLTAVGGQVTTDAEGRFTFTISPRQEPVFLQAETADGMRVATVLEAGASGEGGTVTAPPMNLQSTAAADVFLDARSLFAGVTAADAALHVDHATAASIQAGDLDVGPVAAALAASANAESSFALDAAGGGATQAMIDEARDERRAAYAQLRTQIAAAMDAAARQTALDAFFDAYGAAYTEAGVGQLQTGHAATVASGAGVRFAEGVTTGQRFAMTRYGRMLAAVGVARSVEAEFEAAGATEARLQTLADARATYLASLRAATTDQHVANAAAAYQSVVRTELAGHAGISSAAVNAAFDAAAAHRATLDAGVAGAGTAGAVSQAYAQYYTAAHGAAHTALGIEGAYGANVVVATAAL